MTKLPDNVVIRPYEPGDAEALAEAARESVAEVSPFMPWCHAGYGLADARTWIETTIAGRRDGTLFDFAIMAGGRFAGGCGINSINVMDGVANLGYWVRTSCAGCGIAPAAVAQLLRWVFTNTSLDRIEIVAAVENTRSQRVAEKVGAERDAVLAKRTRVRGISSPAVLYSVLRPDC